MPRAGGQPAVSHGSARSSLAALLCNRTQYRSAAKLSEVTVHSSWQQAKAQHAPHLDHAVVRRDGDPRDALHDARSCHLRLALAHIPHPAAGGRRHAGRRAGLQCRSSRHLCLSFAQRRPSCRPTSNTNAAPSDAKCMTLILPHCPIHRENAASSLLTQQPEEQLRHAPTHRCILPASSQ